MATLYSAAARATAPTPYGAGEVVVRSAKFTPTATTTGGDVVQMVKIPKGAQIVDIKLYFSTMSCTALEVGDGADTDRYFASFDPHAGGFKRQWGDGAAGGLNYVYAAEDTIDVKLTTSTMTTTDSIALQVFYKMSGVIPDETTAFAS